MTILKYLFITGFPREQVLFKRDYARENGRLKLMKRLELHEVHFLCRKLRLL